MATIATARPSGDQAIESLSIIVEVPFRDDRTRPVGIDDHEPEAPVH